MAGESTGAPLRGCDVDGCPSRHEAQGYCAKHYQRKRKGLDPHVPLASDLSTADRFMNRVQQGAGSWGGSPCMEWTGSLGWNGYGRFTVSHGKTVAAHRWSYQQAHGPIPDGLQLDHLCHDHTKCKEGNACPHRRCVNPDHLEPVTAKTNSQRSASVAGENGRKTHCKRGHPFTPENTIILPKGRGCRTCTKMSNRAYEERNREYRTARQRPNFDPTQWQRATSTEGTSDARP